MGMSAPPMYPPCQLNPVGGEHASNALPLNVQQHACPPPLQAPWRHVQTRA